MSCCWLRDHTWHSKKDSVAHGIDSTQDTDSRPWAIGITWRTYVKTAGVETLPDCPLLDAWPLLSPLQASLLPPHCLPLCWGHCSLHLLWNHCPVSLGSPTVGRSEGQLDDHFGCHTKRQSDPVAWDLGRRVALVTGSPAIVVLHSWMTPNV